MKEYNALEAANLCMNGNPVNEKVIDFGVILITDRLSMIKVILKPIFKPTDAV